MRSSVNSDVFLDPREMKFLQVGKLVAGFRLSENGFPLSRNANSKKSLIRRHDDVTNLFITLTLGR